MSLLKFPASTSMHRRFGLLSFAARALEFLVPSPRVTRDVVDACLDYSLEYTTLAVGSSKRRTDAAAGDLVLDLVRAAPENRGTVADELYGYLQRAARSSTRDRSRDVFEIAITIPGQARSRGTEYDPRAFWSALAREFAENHAAVRALARQDPQFALHYFRVGLASVPEIARWHGPAGLYVHGPYALGPASWAVPLADLVVQTAFGMKWTLPAADANTDLQEFAEELESILLAAPRPWAIDEPPPTRSAVDVNSFVPGSLKPRGTPAFCVALLLAPGVESVDSGDVSATEASPNVRPYLELARARRARKLETKTLRAITTLGVSDEQAETLKAWVRGEISFAEAA